MECIGLPKVGGPPPPPPRAPRRRDRPHECLPQGEHVAQDAPVLLALGHGAHLGAAHEVRLERDELLLELLSPPAFIESVDAA